LMELRQLTTFLAVASTLSFTHAADALDYAQSSVTAQIRALEEELGVPLFERLGRRVALSTAGQRLLPYAKQMLQLAEEARGAVPDDQEPGGVLNIGAPESLCAYRLPPVLSRFRTLFPKVQLVFSPDNGPGLYQALSEGRLDLAILLESPAQPGNLITEPLTLEPLLILTYPSHPLAQTPLVRPSDLRHEALLLTEAGCAYRKLFQQMLIAASAWPNNVLEFGSIEAIKQCVMAGMGITFLPAIAVKSELAQGRLVALRWSEGDYRLITQMVWHRDKWLSPALRAFRDLSRAMLANSEERALVETAG
jgi:DNA-binding transcriptional LysR family regulator